MSQLKAMRTGFLFGTDGRLVGSIPEQKCCLQWETIMAVNKPLGDRAHKGAVKKRSRIKKEAVP